MICEFCERPMAFESFSWLHHRVRQWACRACGNTIKDFDSDYRPPDSIMEAAIWEPNATWRRLTPYGPRIGDRVFVEQPRDHGEPVFVEWINSENGLCSMVGPEPGDYELDDGAERRQAIGEMLSALGALAS